LPPNNPLLLVAVEVESIIERNRQCEVKKKVLPVKSANQQTTASAVLLL
jgi:hypothetical protein